jgi:DNA-binding response OmpR family regulator
MRSIRRRFEQEGLIAMVVEPDVPGPVGDDFEDEALHAVESLKPDAMLLDVRFGDHSDDRFRGLSILARVHETTPDLPVLVFSQYASGPHRETVVASSLRPDAPVDFIDKLASPEEVVLRLRRLIGAAPQSLDISDLFHVDLDKRVVYATIDGNRLPIPQVQGMKFDIFLELAQAWYRSPGEVVPFWKLEKYSEGDDSRASLRVRIREVKDALGNANGTRFGSNDLIVSIRNRGYILVPPRN